MSLTKTQMIDWIADKSGQEENEEKAAAGNFLQGRLRMVWNKALWLDSLCQLSMTLDASDTLHAAGLIKLPPIYERILGTRLDDHPLPGHRIEQRYRVGVDAFTETGTPCKSSELGRAVWRYHTPVQLQLKGNDDESDQDKTAFIRYIDAEGIRREETWSMVTSDTYTLSYTAVQVEQMLKQETNNPVRLVALYDVTPVTVETLSGSQLESVRPLWIQIAERPSKDDTLRFLGKVAAPEWRDDEPPPLRNSVDCLIAYALGDMEQRHRQFGKAKEYFGEGAGLLEQLAAVEAEQTQDTQRLIPEPMGGGLFYDDYDFLSKG